MYGVKVVINGEETAGIAHTTSERGGVYQYVLLHRVLMSPSMQAAVGINQPDDWQAVMMVTPPNVPEVTRIDNPHPLPSLQALVRIAQGCERPLFLSHTAFREALENTAVHQMTLEYGADFMFQNVFRLAGVTVQLYPDNENSPYKAFVNDSGMDRQYFVDWDDVLGRR